MGRSDPGDPWRLRLASTSSSVRDNGHRDECLVNPNISGRLCFTGVGSCQKNMPLPPCSLFFVPVMVGSWSSREEIHGYCNLGTLIEKSGGFEIEKDEAGTVRTRRKVARCRAGGKAAARERGCA